MHTKNKTKKTAVALHYPKGFPAPFIVSSGKGKLAEQILALAKEQGIPIICEPDTAALLSLQEAGTYVPPETYEVLAGIFAFLKKVEDYAENTN